MIKLPLDAIKTPTYVADTAKIKRNLEKADSIRKETGCKMLLATKAFSMFSLFEDFANSLDGTTASGLFEARLGHEYFKGEVHAYSPAFGSDEIKSLLDICQHISFNSLPQLREYAPFFRERYGAGASIGLRVNPEISLVTNNSIYDPSAANSRFGVKIDALIENVLEQVNLLHIHNLCENMHDDSVALIFHLMDKIPHALKSVQYVNLGGGHYFTHPDYDIKELITSINLMQRTYDVQVILEPGGALVFDAGYLVASVIDIIDGDLPIAILDTSATCHMPDVLEVPYRPSVFGDKQGGKYKYQLAGKTCLSGDVIGDYSFDRALEIGDKVIFQDMMQYTMVKNTTFNGMPLPDIGVLDKDGTYQLVKRFDYRDFLELLS